METVVLKSAIESLLFVSSKPLKVKELAKILEQESFKIQNALDELVQERRDAGVVVLENNGEYQLATNRANSTIVKNYLNSDLREKLTDATLEVLAIITYRQPISKAEIEAIRGVNSQYSLRHLLMRGLIEKIPNPNDARSVVYQTTTEFLQHMGLVSIKDLPAFEELVGQIKLPETPPLKNEPAEAAPEENTPTEPEPVILEDQTAAPATEPDQPAEPVAGSEETATLPADAAPEPIDSEEPEDSEDEEEFDDDDEDEDDDEEPAGEDYLKSLPA